LPASGQSGEKPPEIEGRVVTGYQGWFGTDRDGFSRGWTHYGRHGDFTHGNVTVDMWPDMTDYDPSLRYDTLFRHADGSVAQVFSSRDYGSVKLHFEWMGDYGIGGAMAQRFATSTRNPDPRVRASVDVVFRHVRRASKETGTPWALMYDLSGLQAGEVVKVIRDDLQRLMADGDFRDDPNYLHHEGKPLIAVWGVGFNDNRSYTLDECIELSKMLKRDPEFGGNALMLGVPYWWRLGERDATDDPRLHELLKAVDIVSPWAVGRMNALDNVDHRVEEALIPDAKWLRQAGVDYLPVIFPGFSWGNLKSTRGDANPRYNSIPRLGGQFLWQQAYNAVRHGKAKMLYVAMFDEVDEATAIFKVSTDPPVGQTRFVGYEEGLESDHYLWLTGEIGKMLRREIPARKTMPTRPAAEPE
jgi:hypothetical protein